MSRRSVIAMAITTSAIVLAALGAFAIIRFGDSSSAPDDQNQSVRIERARNTATAQAACYSAGGTWEQRGSLALANGPEVSGVCVSASELAQRKAEAEEFFATCLKLPDAKVKAAAEGKTLDAYCYDVYKWIAGGRK